MGTKNSNLATTEKQGGQQQHMRRRNSRQSANTFTNVDFEYSGNTNSVQHLIARATRPDKSPSMLNHELNLRTYRNGTTFKGQEAWEYPKAKKYFDPLGLDKPSFANSHQLSKGLNMIMAD